MGEKENEGADVNDSDQEDQLLSNQVIVVDMLQRTSCFHHKASYICCMSVMWTNVIFIPSGAIWL